MLGLGPGELLLLLLILLLLFGARRVPELARGLGQGIREFRTGTRELPGEPEGGSSPERRDP